VLDCTGALAGALASVCVCVSVCGAAGAGVVVELTVEPVLARADEGADAVELALVIVAELASEPVEVDDDADCGASACVMLELDASEAGALAVLAPEPPDACMVELELSGVLDSAEPDPSGADAAELGPPKACDPLDPEELWSAPGLELAPPELCVTELDRSAAT
jgi:hypothetical protein